MRSSIRSLVPNLAFCMVLLAPNSPVLGPTRTDAAHTPTAPSLTSSLARMVDLNVGAEQQVTLYDALTTPHPSGHRAIQHACLKTFAPPSVAVARPPVQVEEPFIPRTRISLRHGRWYVNGHVTYPGSRAEGLLMNVRMVNAVFEDQNRPEFDPEANTDQFLAHAREYAAHGVRAFTLGLQGGMPGYEGALNSAFAADGALRPSYLRRVRRVIEACDRLGVAVILGCYYQRQDQVLTNATALRLGVRNVVRWIQQSRFQNVLLEIANEFDHGGFDHTMLRTESGQIELIQLAKQQAPDLLVSTSGLGHGRFPAALARVADFLLIHFNGVPVEDIPSRIRALKQFGKAIVCNEDDKHGRTAARAATLSVEQGASWGFMRKDVNQYFPLVFQGAADDPVLYRQLKELTGKTTSP